MQNVDPGDSIQLLFLIVQADDGTGAFFVLSANTACFIAYAAAKPARMTATLGLSSSAFWQPPDQGRTEDDSSSDFTYHLRLPYSHKHVSEQLRETDEATGEVGRATGGGGPTAELAC